MASPSSTTTPIITSGGRGRASRSAPRSSGGLTGASSPSGPSPTRLSRVQEKEEMQHLNDRLANYIQRVMQLESQKSAMLGLLEEKEQSKSQEMSNVQRLYETELADTRKSLDELANERARLQLEYGNISEEHTKLRARNQKAESDLAHAVTQWRNLEEALNSKEAEYSNQLGKTKRLTSDVADLKAQQKHLDVVLADTKTQMSSEMLKRVDVENQMQTLKEQLDFERNISEQEILEIRRKHESRLVEVDSGRRAEFDSKLAEAMQQLRQEHEVQIQEYKEELERNFNAKLENAQQTALMRSGADSASKDELTTTKVRVENLSSQLQLYQKEKAVLESSVQDLERTLDRERELWSQRLRQKEQEMETMQSKMLSQLEDYENLLDVKLALDMEINAYRKMLEGAEERLRLSPSPSQHTAVPRTYAHGERRLRGKKRKLEEGSSGGAPAYKMCTNAEAHGPVSIAEVDLEGNYVILKNNSDAEQPLGGWVVRRTHPNIADVSFHIPPSCVLHGGQTLTIWAADTEMQTDPENIVMQGHKSWGPVTDVRVVLLNPEQKEIAERHVACVQATDEDETDMFHEEYIEGRDIQHLRRPDSSTEASCAVM